MDDSIRTGFSFGMTSGIITTLGLMVGLHSGTHSQIAVLGGILTIAVADAFSDALGIHISEESENAHSEKEVWVSTLATFLSKFVVALTFAIPVLLLKQLSTAMIVSVVWGLVMLSVLNISIARSTHTKPYKMLAEHLAIALAVIVTTHYVGDWIATAFKT